jgi:hypothetical protein
MDSVRLVQEKVGVCQDRSANSKKLLFNQSKLRGKEVLSMAKGDYSIRYDPDRLREMIEKGMSAKEITKELKISPFTLREHLAMLQELDKRIYFIKGLFNYSQVEETKVKKEGIIFSKEMLEKAGFTLGDCFEMVVEKDRIILKRVEGECSVDD